MSPTPTQPQPQGKLAGDLWGGLAATLVALPSSIAYGVSAYGILGADYVSHGVIAGILGAAAIGLVAPAIGGAPRLISAPCAPAAAVLAALVTGLLAGNHDGSQINPRTIPVLLTVVALLSGALQLLYGTVRGGQLIKFIPYPVVSGYLSGVAVLIFLSQVPKFFGLPKDLNVWAGLASPSHWKWQGMVVGTATICGVIAAPKITKAVPAPILGLLSGVLVYFGLGFVAYPEMLALDHNKLIIGPIGASAGSVVAAFGDRWQAISAVHFADLKALLFPAFTLSILLSIDTLKTCVIVDAMTRSRHNSNRELIGQGFGNLASAVIGGMPGAGTMGATLVNVSSGGRTRLSGVFAGGFALAAFLLFGGLIAWVPIAALAGILIVVAFRMIDWSSLHLLRSRATILDFLVIAAVIVVAVEVDLIAASGTGLALAVFLFVREQIRGSVIHRKLYGNQKSSKRNRLPQELETLKKHGHLTVVCELRGSLFFGTTDQLFTQIEHDLQLCRFLILDMKRVLSVDFTAAHMLEQIQAMLRERGAFLIFSSLPSSLPTGQNLRTYFDELGVMKRSENVRLMDTLDEAIEWVEDRILEEPETFQHDPNSRPLDLSQFELFQAPESETDALMSLMKACVVERSVAHGQWIFRRGDEGDEIFLVRRGTVRVQLPLEGGKHHTLAYFGPGNFFGEMAFLDRGSRSADAVATTDTDLFILSRQRFEEVLKQQPSIGGKVFARLARVLAMRLRFTDSELRALEEE